MPCLSPIFTSISILNIQKNWWKILATVFLLYTVVMGFMGVVPRLPILNESIRNLYFHVPMWFGMMAMLAISVVNSILYLSRKHIKYDDMAYEMAKMGIWAGVLGLVTGMIWAKYTWGDWWSGDPKQNASAVGMLIYLAYLVLRGSFTDEQQRARISAVYNIFAFAVFIPLIYILPRLTDSLHPGAGGNPGFNTYDLDSNMRWVFYPAVIGWILLFLWIGTLGVRLTRLKRKQLEIE